MCHKKNSEKNFQKNNPEIFPKNFSENFPTKHLKKCYYIKLQKMCHKKNSENNSGKNFQKKFSKKLIKKSIIKFWKIYEMKYKKFGFLWPLKISALNGI